MCVGDKWITLYATYYRNNHGGERARLSLGQMDARRACQQKGVARLKPKRFRFFIEAVTVGIDATLNRR